MEIKRAGSQPSGEGPAEWFTGTVRIDPLFQANAPARAAGAAVTFEPGARTSPRYVARCELGQRRIDALELDDFARLYGKPFVYSVGKAKGRAT